MQATYERVKEILEQDCGYYTEDEIIWQIVTNIDTMMRGRFVSQELYTLCLTGPAGSGKTAFAKVYRKVLSVFLEQPVELVQYQCIPETGKSEMLEEVNIAAVSMRKSEDVMIPGELVQAIDLANQGKYVILFLDEYDKAGAGMDAYLLSFLQEGYVTPTQLGNRSIRPECAKNLQVILCMNQLPKDFTAALSRRRKPMPLHEMRPDIFYTVVRRKLPDANADIVNLVALIYAKLYERRLDFERIPSCSENLWAIHDAGCLVEHGAPQEIVYRSILTNMVKGLDDRATFQQVLRDDAELENFVRKISRVQEADGAEEQQRLRTQVMRDFFAEDLDAAYALLRDAQESNEVLKKENAHMSARVQEQKKQLEEKTQTVAFLEQSLCAAGGADAEDTAAQRIRVGDSLAFTSIQRKLREIVQPDLINSRFSRIQPDRSVFELPQELSEDLQDWNEFGEVILEHVETFAAITHKKYSDYVPLDRLLDWGDDVLIRKDGVVLSQGDTIRVAAVRVVKKGTDMSGQTAYENQYKFYANSLVIPVQAFQRIVTFLDPISDAQGCAFNCLVYSDAKPEHLPITFSPVQDGVYHLRFEKAGGGKLMDAVSRKILTAKEDAQAFSAERKCALEQKALEAHRHMAGTKEAREV